jgi:hypothetical protein
VIARADGVRVRSTADFASASLRSVALDVRRSGSGAVQQVEASLGRLRAAGVVRAYAPASAVALMAIAFVLLVLGPRPAFVERWEHGVIRRLKHVNYRFEVRASLSEAPKTLVTSAAVLAGLAASPGLLGQDLDGLMLITAVVLLLGSVCVTRVWRGQTSVLTLAASCGLLAMWVALLLFRVASLGVFDLSEVVMQQGAWPGRWACVSTPLGAVLAFASVAVMVDWVRTQHVAPKSVAERAGVVLASGLVIALFFGGWRLPFGSFGKAVRVFGACVYLAKVWALVTSVYVAAQVGSVGEARLRWRGLSVRYAVALVALFALSYVARRGVLGPSLELAMGGALVTVFALFVLRVVLGISAGFGRPEPRPSPFL